MITLDKGVFWVGAIVVVLAFAAQVGLNTLLENKVVELREDIRACRGGAGNEAKVPDQPKRSSANRGWVML